VALLNLVDEPSDDDVWRVQHNGGNTLLGIRVASGRPNRYPSRSAYLARVPRARRARVKDNVQAFPVSAAIACEMLIFRGDAT